MENQDDHHASDDEIPWLEIDDLLDAPIDESDVSGYEWEGEIQVLWQEMDEVVEEVTEENPESSLEEEFEEPVYVVNKVD